MILNTLSWSSTFRSAILACALMATPALAQSNPFTDAMQQGQFPPPEQVFQLDYHQVDSLLTVSFDIRDGFYMYQHRFGFEPEHLVHQLHPMPEGIAYHDEFFGDTVIYRDRVALQVDLNAAQRNEVLTIRYQGCADAGFCYPPSTQTIFLRRTEGAGASSNGTSPTPSSNTERSPYRTLFWIALVAIAIVGSRFILQRKSR